MDETDACDMHDADKIGQSAIGELVRSKNKKKVNEFKEGVSAMKEATKMLQLIFLAYDGTRADKLKEQSERLKANFVKPQVDKSGTRVAAPHCLVLLILRNKKAIKSYAAENANFKVEAIE